MSAPGTVRVSVITIFRDPGRFLDEAVESVREQTMTDWELLLVDDGSTDGTGQRADDWAKDDPARVRVLRHSGGRNQGMSASRNLGLANARGRWVGLLDADDVYLPGKLEQQLELLARHPTAQIVYGPMSLWYGWTGDEQDAGRDRVRRVKVPIEQVIDAPRLFLPYLRGTAPTPATCSVLFEREAALRLGGFENRFRGMFEDQAFFCKTALALPCVVTDRPGDLYRQHEGSISAQSLTTGQWSRTKPSPARRLFLEWLEEYLSVGDARSHLLRAVRRELFPYRHARAAEVLGVPGRMWRVTRTAAVALTRRIVP